MRVSRSVVPLALAAVVAIPSIGSAATVLRAGDKDASSSAMASGIQMKKWLPTTKMSFDFKATQVYRESIGYDDQSNQIYGPQQTRKIDGKGDVVLQCGKWENTWLGPIFYERFKKKRVIRSNRVTKVKMPKTRSGERCYLEWDLDASKFDDDVLSTRITLVVKTLGKRQK